MRQFIRLLWHQYERLFARVAGLRPIGEVAQGRRVGYYGPPADALLQKGVPMVEVHLKSDVVAGFHSGGSAAAAVRYLRGVKAGLKVLAVQMTEDPAYRDCQGIFGITLLGRGLGPLGFHSADLPPGLFRWWMHRWMAWLLYLYHPEGSARFSHGHSGLVPQVVWMGREEFLDRYLRQTGAS